MRLAYVCADPGVPVFGQKGCSVHVQEVLRGFVRAGASVELFASRIAGAPPRDLQDITIHQLPCEKFADVQLQERFALASNTVLQGLLERNAPFDAVYERYSLWGHAAMAFARAADIPGVLEVNAPLIEEQSTYRELLNRVGAAGVARRAFHNASSIVAVSKEVADYVATFGVDRGKVHVIPNGVNPQRFVRPPQKHGNRLNSQNHFTIGFVGTLKPWHGTLNLAKAFGVVHHQDPTTQLLIVGDGPERNALREYFAGKDESTKKSVRFSGAVAASEIPSLLHQMDVAVAPYPEMSNFYFSPLKVFEYMAAGLPVVASDIGQISHVIQHDVNGLLVPPGNVPELTAALFRLRGDVDLRRRLAVAARQTILEKFTWDIVVRRVLRLSQRTTTKLSRSLPLSRYLRSPKAASPQTQLSQ